jgi:hypothetical protein
VAQTSSMELSGENRIQSQLNGAAALMPLHVLAEYLEALQLELRELPERIQSLQIAIEAKRGNQLHQEGSDNSLRMELETLRKELRETPIHIRRVQRAIEARQRKFLTSEPEWFRISGSANSEERATPIQREKTRNPIAMLRGEYKGMKLADIAAKVLSAEPAPLTTTQLTQRIYCTRSNDEFERARNSLSTELRVGAKSSNPRWRKCGRYAYCGLHLHPEAAM